METMKRGSKRGKRGLVLPVIAAIAICLALLGLGVLRLGFGSRLMATRTMAGVTARAAADAGITRVLYEMNVLFDSSGWGSPLPPNVIDQPLGNSNATFSYQIGPIEMHPVTGERYRVITSVGKLGSQQSTVYATLGMRNLFEYGLIVTDSIDLKQDTIVDGYTSHDIITGARYEYGFALPDGSLNAFRNVKIGTTYSGHDPMIVLRNNVTVTGQVLVGVGGNTEEIINPLGNPGPTTGGYGVLPEAWLWDLDLLEITVPVGIDSGSITPSDFTDSTLKVGVPDTPTLLRYSSVNIPNSNNLIFQGQVEMHITGTMNIGASGRLFVGDPDPLAPIPVIPNSLVIYLDGDLDIGQSGAINNLSRLPVNFKLFGTGSGQTWIIKNEGDFYGVYYGPDADIRIFAKGEFFGSVSGRRFELKAEPGPDYGLHYDIALAKDNRYDVGFGIDRLWEKSEFVAAGL